MTCGDNKITNARNPFRLERQILRSRCPWTIKDADNNGWNRRRSHIDAFWKCAAHEVVDLSKPFLIRPPPLSDVQSIHQCTLTKQTWICWWTSTWVSASLENMDVFLLYKCIKVRLNPSKGVVTLDTCIRLLSYCKLANQDEIKLSKLATLDIYLI